MKLEKQYWWVPRLRKIFRIRNAVRMLFLSSLCFIFLDLLFPLPPEKPYSQRVYAADGSLLHTFLSSDDKWRMKTRLSDLPPELPNLLLAKEDRWFWNHPGVNPLAIVRAAWNNLLLGKRSSGASTITMQVARLLEPKPRTIFGKMAEAFRAFQLEWHFSKSDILEMYLSYLPYGGNVEGIGAASQLYFQRPAAQLSLAQCVLLAVIPNRPNSLRPDHHPIPAQNARDKWLRRLHSEGYFGKKDLETALSEPIPNERSAMPARNPQFAYFLSRKTESEEIQSTIDPKAQQLSSDLLANHVRRLQIEGITNGAVLVLDNQTMQVKAYCGSADFENKEADGEMDATHAVRSPGSTLKPFIFAQAFDQGIITPKMKLLDIPADYDGFAPVNYARTFQGEVGADDALRHSLNIPAIRLLGSVGLSPFLDKLAIAGFEHISRDRAKMGLSVALGGCGATLSELVAAYAALANAGIYRPIEFTKSVQSEKYERRICSPEAAFLVTEILAGIERPDLPSEFIERSKLPRVAWKTGTSFGRRDAWAIGYNPRYTVGVWMGNMDGSTVLGMSGGKTAVPLMLEIFNAVDYDAEKTWFPKPTKIRTRQVCKFSGKLPAPFCNQLMDEYAISGLSPTERCSHAREILCDAAQEVQYCPSCVPEKDFQMRLYPNYAPNLALWMDRSGILYEKPPLHNPNCTAVFQTPGPKIFSPAADAKYLVESGKEILLQAAPTLDAQRHYWYSDGDFIGSCPAGEKLFFEPKDGKHQIECMDDKGRKTIVKVEVEIF